MKVKKKLQCGNDKSQNLKKKIAYSACGQARPLQLNVSISAISSALSSKSNTSKLDWIRLLVTDFGITL